MEIVCAIKKRPGKLVLAGQVSKWTPVGGGPPIESALSNVQGMQATPPTAAKSRIKSSPKEGSASMSEFSGASELEKARNDSQEVIKRYRDSEGASTPTNASTAGTSTNASTNANSTPTGSAAPGSATPSSATPGAGPGTAPKGESKRKKLSLDPEKLVQNLDSQRAVLRQDPELMRTFEQVVIKSGALTNEQFWAPRSHSLVTAAQQQVQTRGSYNVSSTIKPTTSSDNRVNINSTREKIADSFDQYPLVRRAYNENVPKLSEGEFWQRFFMSRSFLVSRGEKVAATHAPDASLDPYIAVLHELQEKQRQRRRHEDSAHPAPSFVNVEGNAENNPETYGNDIVTTAGGGTRSLIRSMNGLSQRSSRGKRKSRETEADVAVGVGDMREESSSHDLEPPEHAEREVGLEIREFPGEEREKQASEAESVEEVRQNNREFPLLAPKHIDLVEIVESDALLNDCHRSVSALTPHPELVSVQNEHVSGEVQLVYATTIEFLKQFWYAVAHKPAEEARASRTYLENSLARIDAVNGMPASQAVADSVQAASNATI